MTQIANTTNVGKTRKVPKSLKHHRLGACRSMSRIGNFLRNRNYVISEDVT